MRTQPRRPDARASSNPIRMAEQVIQTPITRLTPYANNNRVHTSRTIDRLRASIARFGFVTPILVDGNGVIIAGHGRVKAARALGLATVPTVVADHLSPAEVRALRIADNRLAELSEWNPENLQIEFAELMELSLGGELEFDLDITGFELPGIDIIIDGAGAYETAPPETVEAPDPGRPAVTQPGDLWLLGDHRLLCGDALEAASHDRVLDGDLAGADREQALCPESDPRRGRGHSRGLWAAVPFEFAIPDDNWFSRDNYSLERTAG